MRDIYMLIGTQILFIFWKLTGAVPISWVLIFYPTYCVIALLVWAFVKAYMQLKKEEDRGVKRHAD